jgi:hypothetical protein
MKRKFTPIKLLFSILFSLITIATSAQTATLFSGPSDVATAQPASASAVQKLICNGAQIVLTSTDAATTYQWYKKTSTGTMQLVQSSSSNTYTETSTATAGYYIYTLVTINSNGCESPMSDPYDVFVFPPLNPTITPSSTNVCAGQTNSILTASPVSDANYTYSYQWTRDGVNVGTNSNTYTVSEATGGTTVQYDVQVSYTMNPSCSVLAPAQTITVIALPVKPTIQW